MDRKIIWSHQSFNFNERKAKWEEYEGEEPSYDDGDYNDLMDALPNSDKIGTLLQTPFGFFNVDDQLNPFRRLEFWEASTNFDITSEIKYLIETTPGVEVLNILTRYRFLVAIGRAFDFRNVRIELDSRICGIKIESTELVKEIKDLQEKLSVYKDYAIYIFPNGKIDWAVLESDESNKNDYMSKVDTFMKARDLSNGKILYKSNESIV